jgi:hypothetical protein
MAFVEVRRTVKFSHRHTQTIAATTCRHHECCALRASTRQIPLFAIAKEIFVRSGLPANPLGTERLWPRRTGRERSGEPGGSTGQNSLCKSTRVCG